MIAIDRSSPLVLEPKLTAAIWGGDALVRRYGKAGDPAALLGESWECWDENRIVSGTLTGQTVAAARAVLGAALMGPLDAAQRFPVLTKIIDANAALSVQVHPDDAYAQRVEGEPFGKTECWYVLDARPDAELVLGWTHDTTRAEVERRIADGTLGEILRRVPVRAGETFYLPAGTVHAIGAGVQLFETQQASDLTYRLFDWNRVGPDGKPRQLHVAKALDVLDYRATMPGAAQALVLEQTGSRREILVADHRFAVERLTFGTAGATVLSGGRPVAVLAAGDALALTSGGAAPLGRWQTALVPAAAAEVVLRPAGGAAGCALVVRVAPDLAALRADAVGVGVTADRLAEFLAQFRSGAAAPPG